MRSAEWKFRIPNSALRIPQSEFLSLRISHADSNLLSASPACCAGCGFGSGLRGSFSSRFAAWYTNDATITAFFIMSLACSRSYTSMFEWCVRVSVLDSDPG